jgi:COP9 signalosome complex subunit 7
LRELEDLILDCIYNELVSGKLDQLNQQFHVVYTFGRDLRESDINFMLKKLEDWDRQLETAQHIIEDKARSCNQSILNTYDIQLRHEMSLREKR